MISIDTQLEKYIQDSKKRERIKSYLDRKFDRIL